MLKYIKNVFREPILQIALTIVFCFFTYQFLSNFFIRAVLTLSILLKNFMLFIVPFLILSGTSIAFSSFKKNGVKFVVVILCIIVISNITNVMLSGAFAISIIPHFSHFISEIKSNELNKSIDPYFSITFPQISSSLMLIIGISSGITSNFINLKKWMNYMAKVHNITIAFIVHVFIPTLPIFLMGFLLKMLKEDKLIKFLQNNGSACFLMIGFLWTYLSIWWLCASFCSKIHPFILLKTIFPAFITGATTMSSMAALPFSIKSATKNTKDPILANAVMPITVNFHQIGDSVCIPILSIIMLNGFGYNMPTFPVYILFGIGFVLNKFGGIGIPGGSMIISLPLLQHYLNFQPEMLALVTAFYMLIDPITTSANVLVNNFLIIFVQKIWKHISK